MKHFKIIIQGKVQGVGFRYAAKNIAQRAGLKGYVRNQTDGSVYIEIEGEDEAVYEFVSWCKSGPARAMVSEIAVEEDTLQHYTGFEVGF